MNNEISQEFTRRCAWIASSEAIRNELRASAAEFAVAAVATAAAPTLWELSEKAWEAWEASRLR